MSLSAPFRTDAVTKTSLNVGLIPSAGASTGRGVAGSSGLQNAGSAEPSSEAYLDTFQEELQKKVDTEVGVLVDGLQECVQLAKVGTKDRFKAEQDAVEVELKAESMVRATEALLSLSHTLKLLFLLNDEDEGSSRIIETQQEQMTEDLKDAKKEAESLLASLLERQ